jgi:uncharacterized protein (TIGR02145 family)
MKKLFIVTSWVLCSTTLLGQNLQMTFTASGTTNKVDSIKATNLRTNESVSLPGNETLILFPQSSGITIFPEPTRQGLIYPNPCTGKATMVVNILKSQTILAEVFCFTGQSVARILSPVQAGHHNFSLSFARAGVYLVSVSSGQGTAGMKVICQETAETTDRILYEGIAQGFDVSPLMKKATVFTLGYEPGDILLYLCKSGKFKTVVTDSPVSSTNYGVGFVTCEDPDSNNYAVVKIGYQTWMAENLAWLPKVTPSSKGSDSLMRYYVYGYEDSLVTNAKNTTHYKKYGVLYNFPAAMNKEGKWNAFTEKWRGACPEGWHIPGDEEWKILEKYLGMSQAVADTFYLRLSGNAGGKLKSSVSWADPGKGTNATGFTALPGGYRNTHEQLFPLLVGNTL